MAKIGDTVRFLNTTGGGVIRRIEGNIAYVDDNGFETPTLLRECVVVAPAAETMARVASTQTAPEEPEPITADNAHDSPLPDESPEGEKLNVVIAYEATDLKALSNSAYDTYLVNDSNYWLYFVYATRADGEELWTTRYAGMVEPSMQVYLGQVQPSELTEMDRVSVQLVAFKSGRGYAQKNPVSVEMALDTTKFFKLHCFRESPYFDDPVISLTIVENDIVRARKEISQVRIEEGIKAKKAIDRGARKPVVKRAHTKKKGDVIEVDLHITELIDNTAGLTNADLLNMQIDEFRRVMDANLRNKGQKIVFIHGKGEGVLRKALLKELNHRYKGHQVQDASFAEYGFGATQVTI